MADGDPAQLADSSAAPSGTRNDDGRQDELTGREKSQAKRQADRLDAEATRRFSDEIDSLKTRVHDVAVGQ